MERPAVIQPMAHARPLTPARIASIGFVALLHVLFIYALITGLAQRFVQQIPHEITAEVVKPPPEKPQPPPPVEVNLPQPAMPTVQPPMVKIQQPRVVTHAITTVVAPPAPPTPAPPVVVKAPPPAPTPAKGIMSTHTRPPYPPEALRLSQQGKVLLRMAITADGSVSDASVVGSSGSSALDQAAVEWVKEHWRYKPATQDGHPVATTQEAAIVFDLKNAG